MVLKDSLSWGEDAIFDWEKAVAHGEREVKILEQYKLQNADKFKVNISLLNFCDNTALTINLVVRIIEELFPRLFYLKK